MFGLADRGERCAELGGALLLRQVAALDDGETSGVDIITAMVPAKRHGHTISGPMSRQGTRAKIDDPPTNRSEITVFLMSVS